MKTKLKHILLVAGITILTSATTATFAQDRKAGIKGGLNVSNLYVDDVDDENARYGFNAGVYGEVVSTEAFGIQLELLYSTKGSKYENDNQEVKFNMNYIDVPVLAVFKLGEAVEIHAGGYAAYLVHANVTTEGFIDTSNDLDRDNFRSFDYGLVGGVGFNFGAAQIGARYNYGLNKLADSDAADAVLGNSKNSYGQVYLAFNLNHK